MTGKKNRIQKLIILLIILVGIFARFYQLGKIPALHTDEADFAYNALSILRTGHDQSGNVLPLGTTSIGDLRPAFYVYLSLPFIWFMGLTELAVRLPAAIFSVLTIGLIYFWVIDIFRDRKLAVVSTALMSLSFWHLALSLEASEKVVALFLVIFGLWLVVKYLSGSKTSLFWTGIIVLIFSIHTYYAPRFFLLLYLPILALIYLPRLNKKQRGVVFIGFLIFFIITAYFSFFFKIAGERINQLILFNNPQTVAVLNQQIAEHGTKNSVLLTRIFHNKPVNFSLKIFRNYLEYFSPLYLLTDGGYPKRVRVPDVGLVNPFSFPFVFIGLWYMAKEILIKREKSKERYLMLFVWLILAPLPAALTFDEIPNVYRTLIMLPAMIVMMAFGLVKSWPLLTKNFLRKAILSLLIIGYFWNYCYFLDQYFVHFEVRQPWFRKFAQKELALFIIENGDQYERIYINKLQGGTEQMLRFYLNYDPKELQRQGWPKDQDYQGLDNLIFVPERCPFPELINKKIASSSANIIMANDPDCQITEEDPAFETVKTIFWQDGNPAYQLVHPISSENDPLPLKGGH